MLTKTISSSYFIILVKPNLGINHQSQDMLSSSDESLNTTERNQLIVKDTPQDGMSESQVVWGSPQDSNDSSTTDM